MADQSLRDSLARMQGVLAGPPLARLPPGPPAPPRASLAARAQQLGFLALFFIVLGFATGQKSVIAIGVALAAAGGMSMLPQLLARKGKNAVGLGAEVAADAVLEPGATVEMGASVGSRAVVKAGAVIRMGATVHEGAIIERGAVVSWGADVHARAVVGAHAVVGAGADVHEDAVVGENAVVGAGADVHAGARVQPGLRLGAGSDFHGGMAALPAPSPDPRSERLAAVWRKLEEEWAASPATVRSFLGGSEDTLAALRSTCEALAARERALRFEADEAALKRLDDERAALLARIDAQPDEQIRASLRGAVAALDEQKRQREQVRLTADRLEAESTRLLYTLEGLAAQFVRLRSAGTETAPRAAVEQGVLQLRDELNAISDALEQVNLRAVAEAPATAAADEAAAPAHKLRGR